VIVVHFLPELMPEIMALPTIGLVNQQVLPP